MKKLFLALLVITAMLPITAMNSSSIALPAQENIEEIVKVMGLSPLRNWNYLLTSPIIAAMGVEIPKGCLITGPQGTGKTAYARECAPLGIPFFACSGSDFVNTYVGTTGEAGIRMLFKAAREAATSNPDNRAIIFIDEIDSIEDNRESLHALLTEMDRYEAVAKIFVLATTNRVEALDPALLRAGRFQCHCLAQNHPKICSFAMQGKESNVRSILSQPEIDINEASTHNWHALHFAAYYGHGPIVKLLLSYPNIVSHPLTKSGLTPYKLAELCASEMIRAGKICDKDPRAVVQLLDQFNRCRMATFLSFRALERQLQVILPPDILRILVNSYRFADIPIEREDHDSTTSHIRSNTYWESCKLF